MDIQLETTGKYYDGTGYMCTAKVTNINEDGTVDVQAEDGGQLHSVAVVSKDNLSPESVGFVAD